MQPNSRCDKGRLTYFPLSPEKDLACCPLYILRVHMCMRCWGLGQQVASNSPLSLCAANSTEDVLQVSSSGGGFVRRPDIGKGCAATDNTLFRRSRYCAQPHHLGTFFCRGAVARRPGSIIVCVQGVGRCSGGTGSGPDVHVWDVFRHATLALAPDATNEIRRRRHA